MTRVSQRRCLLLLQVGLEDASDLRRQSTGWLPDEYDTEYGAAAEPSGDGKVEEAVERVAVLSETRQSLVSRSQTCVQKDSKGKRTLNCSLRARSSNAESIATCLETWKLSPTIARMRNGRCREIRARWYLEWRESR